MIRKSTAYILINLILASSSVIASAISNGLFVTPRSLDFDKHLISGKCYGKITYPEFSNEDTELFNQINEEVRDFVELYAVCNQGDRDNFSVRYDVPESNSNHYFSVRWLTDKDDKLWRIDSLNFNKKTGDLVTAEDIFNNMSGNLVNEFIKLSKNRLSPDTTWEKILDKINTRDIQLYIKQKQWYAVFNALPEDKELIEAKIPDYFLRYEEDDREK